MRGHDGDFMDDEDARISQHERQQEAQAEWDRKDDGTVSEADDLANRADLERKYGREHG